jgi:hypothetical protein
MRSNVLATPLTMIGTPTDLHGVNAERLMRKIRSTNRRLSKNSDGLPHERHDNVRAGQQHDGKPAG